MFVVSGVTGHTGSAVASTLLEAGKRVRVVVRDATKGDAWKARGAEVAVASLDDAAALTRALAGAEGVYALVPPDFGSDDPFAAQARIVDAWGKAIREARPKHVVFLSSVGADLAEGTGPIRTLHLAETTLAPLGAITFVRAAYFQENWGSVAAPVKSDGILPSMLTLGRAVPMVATADIGRAAAEALLEGERAPRVVELAGPRDFTPEEVAAAFGAALGKPVKAVPVPDEAMEPALLQAGLKPKLAAAYREMTVGVNRGTIAFRGAPRRGRVGIEETVRRLLGSPA